MKLAAWQILIAIPLIIVFTSYSKKHTTVSTLYQPAHQYNWIKEYYLFNRSISADYWLNKANFSFDSLGVIKANNNYNPVSVSQYALYCYDQYNTSKDLRYKDQFIAQAKYLINSKSYHLKNDTCVAYPYQFVFHDLKPPWYSGLAQAEVISVLIRYYAMTTDVSVVPLITGIRNFLFLPLSQGGVLNQTAEGAVWIEEYPNSKQHLHVLNGFLITTIGLIEYCQMFPADTYAEVIKNKCLESIKKCIPYYETGTNWLTYDRGKKSAVSSWYMKAQVLEMEQLYLLTGDDFFKRQAMIWSTYTFEKVIELPGCKLNYANLGTPLEFKNNQFTLIKDRSNILSRTIIKNDFAEGFENTFYGFNLTDNNAQTIFNLKPKSKHTEGKINYLFRQDCTLKSIVFSTNSDSADVFISHMEYSFNDIKSEKSRKDLTKTKSKNEIIFTLNDPIKASKLTLFFGSKNNGNSNIAEIKFMPADIEMNLLKYHYFVSKVFSVDNNNVTIKPQFNKNTHYLICYRTGNDKNLNKIPWLVSRSLSYPETLLPIGDGHCYAQYMIIFPSNDHSIQLQSINTSNLN